MKQVSNGVIVDGKEVFVFRVCEYDAVVSSNVEEAIQFYKEYTGLSDEDIYELEYVETININECFYIEEGKPDMITFKESIERSEEKIPYIICRWD